MTTNVERANPPDDADERQASTLLYELDRDERQRQREAQRAHARAWLRYDAACRDLRTRCGFCGLTSMSDTALRVLAADFAGPGAMGHIEIGFDSICLNLWRTYDQTRNQPQLVLWKSIKRAGLAEYHPAKDSHNADRARVGLSWAGWTYRARTAGADDPGDIKVPYSHLEGIKASMIDFSPLMPEPVMARRL